MVDDNPPVRPDTPFEVVEDVTLPNERKSHNDPPEAIPDPLAQCKEQLAAVEKDRKEIYDRLLRTAADFDNFRKRSRKDQDDARAKGREEVLKEILAVADNLERALKAAEEPSASVAHVVEGVKLVLRQLANALERFEVRGFSALGEPFDPTRHEAVSQIESQEHPSGSVAAEMQRGYTMGPRLLRPALVAVAKPPAEPEKG